MKKSTVLSSSVSRELSAMKQTETKTDHSLTVIISVLVAVFGSITAFCLLFPISIY